MARRPLRAVAILVVAVSASIAGACGSSASTTTSAPADYYVSLGDSYAAGYQPTGRGAGHTTTNGFAYQIVRVASARGYHFTLVNFGCSGATTTTSILSSVGCPPTALGPGGASYRIMTQAAAAEQFLRAHRGHIGLVTVSISGNDVTHCAASGSPVTCVLSAVAAVKANLAKLLPALRNAAGRSVPIVGTTYPDVLLGLWVSGDRSLAQLSLVAFKSLLNPALAESYRAVDGTFVDITTDTGAYIPLDQTTTLAPYGTIPVAVAKTCELTFFCRWQNIHPTTPGYSLIADAVTDTLPRR